LQLGPSINKIATVVWIVGITNAVNFMDGLDGLATGISSIASLCMMFIAIIYGDPISVLLTAALAGACLGFLPHNFSPASIFMGDTGSTFLGFTLAVISAESLLKSYTAITWVIPIIILGLPIFDTSFAIIRRLANGKSPMQADRGHLHHRLVDKGYSHRRAVLTLYVVASGFGIAGILMALNDMPLALVIIGLILLFWFVDYLYTTHKKKNSQSIEVVKETVRVLPYLSFNKVYGFETLSDMVDREQSKAAVTAGFFYMYGRPSGLVVNNGKTITAGSGQFNSLIIEKNKAYFQKVNTKITATLQN
jgi:hypothetical protein